MKAVYFVLAFLVAVEMGLAVAAVRLYHEARVIQASILSEEARARSFDIEWRQLLLERAAFGQGGRVEAIARTKFGLRDLTPQDVRIVVLPNKAP